MHASPELRRAAAALPEHPNLDRVVAQLNIARRVFDRRQLDLANMTVKDVSELRAFIHTDLEPEHLYEDGALTHAQAVVKERILRYALTELNQLVRHKVRV